MGGREPSGAIADGLLDHFDFLPYAPSGAMGVRRTVFRELGGFADVPFAEDVDFCWRAALAGKQLSSVPGAVVHYRYRPTLRAMFAQARRYGAAQPLLYRRYRDAGMPGRSVRDVCCRVARPRHHARVHEEQAGARDASSSSWASTWAGSRVRSAIGPSTSEVAPDDAEGEVSGYSKPGGGS